MMDCASFFHHFSLSSSTNPPSFSSHLFSSFIFLALIRLATLTEINAISASPFPTAFCDVPKNNIQALSKNTLQSWEADSQEDVAAFEFCMEADHCRLMTLP
jgi:hypothetical protein